MSRPNGIVALIPARAGSKGIPGKNVRPFLGRPLLVWTVETALASGVFDAVILSTDSPSIAALGREAGAEAPFLRPAELARDDAPTAPVARHALDFLVGRGQRPTHVFILEPTSPGRRPGHIRQAAELLLSGSCDTVASIGEVPHHHAPVKQLRLTPDGRVAGLDGTHPRDMIHRRQDLPTSYAFDGLIFACRAECLWRNPPTLWGERVAGMPVDPRYCADLDRPEDWAWAEAKLRDVLLEGQGT